MNCNMCKERFDAITSDNEFICSVCNITKNAVPIHGNAPDCPLLKCLWCGWVGKKEDLTMNEHDEPKRCPVCDHDEFKHPMAYTNCENMDW